LYSDVDLTFVAGIDYVGVLKGMGLDPEEK
jgi:hypothetical protein